MSWRIVQVECGKSQIGLSETSESKICLVASKTSLTWPETSRILVYLHLRNVLKTA